jgi:hypothetical protein
LSHRTNREPPKSLQTNIILMPSRAKQQEWALSQDRMKLSTKNNAKTMQKQQINTTNLEHFAVGTQLNQMEHHYPHALSLQDQTICNTDMIYNNSKWVNTTNKQSININNTFGTLHQTMRKTFCNKTPSLPSPSHSVNRCNSIVKATTGRLESSSSRHWWNNRNNSLLILCTSCLCRSASPSINKPRIMAFSSPRSPRYAWAASMIRETSPRQRTSDDAILYQQL